MSNRLLSVLLVAAALLSGCATTDPQTTKTREINSERVSNVERVAQSAGVEIVWINPPTRVREGKFETSKKVGVERNE
jgi:type IV pilus biogenesis protein CpaD/CtpE